MNKKLVFLCVILFNTLNVANAKGGGGGGHGGGGHGGGGHGGGRGGAHGGSGRGGAVAVGIAAGAAAGAGAVAVANIAAPDYYYMPSQYGSPTPPTLPPAVVPNAPQPSTTPPPEIPCQPAIVPALPLPLPPPTAASSGPQPPLSLTIYYDAMSVISQKFFNKTFVEQFPAVATLLDVGLIPCQLAEVKGTDLICPTRTDQTCILDKTHSCAIAQITDKTKLVPYLACTMSSMEKLPDFRTCATQAQVDDKQLQSCANSDQGVNLCGSYIGLKPPGDPKMMPKFIFKRFIDIRSNQPFEHLDYYINNVCATHFKHVVCVQLKVIKAPTIPEECNKKLILGIFYKTMDERSQRLIQSLAQLYDKFGEHLIIKFQPCMFVEFIKEGKLDCKDQTDPDCVAAKTHACAATLIEDPKLLMQFMKCVTQDSSKLPDFEKCAQDNQIPFDTIKSCASSDLGKALCYDFSKTRPKTDKIPAFSFQLTFDGKVSEDTAAAIDLKPILCDQLKKFSIETPSDCS